MFIGEEVGFKDAFIVFEAIFVGSFELIERGSLRVFCWKKIMFF